MPISKERNNDESSISGYKTKYKNNSFVFIGRIIKEKGVIELLKAIVKFNRKYPRKANFTIIGSKYENNTLNFFFDDLIKKKYTAQ